MRAIQYGEPRVWNLIDVPTPVRGPGEVLVRILSAGVCGTDRHLHEGEFGPVYPLTPGHEIVGEIFELGPDVERLSVGDVVVVDNSWSCGQCIECRRGMGHYCEHWESQGINLPGAFAEYLVARDTNCWVVNDIALDTAVLAEPTACAIHGLDRLGLKPGSSVAVLGAGPSALILTQLLRAGGAYDVTVCAPTQFKLDLALELGATRVIRLERENHEANRRALAAVAPDGFDVVIDATGAVPMLELALSSTRIGGTIFIYGMTDEKDTLQISPYDIFRRELTIIGSVSQVNCFDRAVAALRNGVVTGEGIVTHRFTLDQYGDALATSAESPCIKAVIEPSPS